MCQAFNEMLANSRLEGERISLLLAELLIKDNRLNDISLARKDPKHFEMLCKEYEIAH